MDQAEYTIAAGTGYTASFGTQSKNPMVALIAANIISQMNGNAPIMEVANQAHEGGARAGGVKQVKDTGPTH